MSSNHTDIPNARRPTDGSCDENITCTNCAEAGVSGEPVPSISVSTIDAALAKLKIPGPEEGFDLRKILRVVLLEMLKTIEDPALGNRSWKEMLVQIITQEATRRESYKADLTNAPRSEAHDPALLLAADLLDDLSHEFIKRSQAHGDALMLDLSILTALLAVDSVPDHHQNYSFYTDHLGYCLELRFSQVGRVSDLEDAISWKRRAVELADDSNLLKIVYLSNLGASLASRYTRFGYIADLDEAITMNRRVIGLMSVGHPGEALYYNNLGGALWYRYQCKGESSDLDEAITSLRHAVETTPDGDRYKLGRLNNLAVALESRYKILNNFADLDEAISVQRSTLDFADSDHADKPMSLSNLGNMLKTRHTELGGLIDIEDAIAFHRKAVKLTPDDHPYLPDRLNNLSISLLSRFLFDEGINDLQEAIAYLQKTVGLTDDDHPKKALYLHNLSIALRNRYARLREPCDVEDAVATSQRSVDLTHSSHPDKPMYFSNLGSILETRFVWHRLEVSDHENAILASRQAVALTSAEHPNAPLHISLLGTLLSSGYTLLHRFHELEEAILMDKRAAELTADANPLRASRIHSVGRHYRLRLFRSQDSSDFENAYNHLIEAAYNPSGFSHTKLTSALELAALCTEFPNFVTGDDKRLQAHQSVVDSIYPVVRLGQSASRRYESLTRFNIGTATIAAAACAISAENHNLALEWLEAGRNVVWTQLYGLQRSLEDLRTCDPDLATELEAVSKSLHKAERITPVALDAERSTFLVGSPDLASLESNAVRIRRLAHRYDELIARVRVLDGFESFLRPKRISELVPACRNGPVIVLIAHSSRCDALVLHHSGQITHVPLPSLSFHIAEQLQEQLLNSVNRCGARTPNDRLVRGALLRHTAGPQTIKRILEHLWNVIVNPILSCIKDSLIPRGGKPPHVTWCATGPFAFLPLHAAGIYDSRNPARAIRASDIIVSSYTPSLSALLTRPGARKDSTPVSNTIPEILVVSQPQTPGQSPIPCTVDEALVIKEHFPTSTHLNDNQATVNAVLSLMSENSWVHLACHGLQHAEDATKSAFALHDGVLELERLMRTSLPRAELAVLSACQTAKGDSQLPEETVHLAAGMLAAGYKNVVATMWEIVDEDGPAVADALYARLKQDLVRREESPSSELDVAYALHEAVTVLKERIGEDNFLRWMPFVHYGR